jgi:hypothetical protein
VARVLAEVIAEDGPASLIILLRMQLLIGLQRVVATVSLHVSHVKALFNAIELVFETVVHNVVMLLDFVLARFEVRFHGLEVRLTHLFVLLHLALIVLHLLVCCEVPWYVLSDFP